MIGTNLFEFIPQTPLQFQEGDIFGIYQVDRFLYDQKHNGPRNLRSRGILNSSPQTISITELENDGNDFPLVTVEISNISTISARPINKALITIIPLNVLLILAGVLTAVLLITITVYCIKRKKKGKTNSRSSPNNDSLSNLRASVNLATSNPLYDNPDGTKTIFYNIHICNVNFNLQVCVSQYCQFLILKLLYLQYQMMTQMLL